ncbi:MAG: hypothetical protein GY751_08905 [Bacteroidetes bacterium]|nr:hypothetical protein [Bacteroidota bacterium]
MKNRYLKTVVFICMAFIVLAAGKFHSASDESEAGYPGNRFGKLTSSVWRYQSDFVQEDLAPVANNNPTAEKQPKRDRPTRITLNNAQNKAYITLQGTEESPGNSVVVFDIVEKEVSHRIEVGSRPYMGKLHPGGRFLVIINELSNYASIIDTETDKVSGEIPLDFYCQGIAFSNDGKTAYVANRYLDQVLVVDLDIRNNRLDGKVRPQGGFDEATFYGTKPTQIKLPEVLSTWGFSDQVVKDAQHKGTAGINSILRAKCKNCHAEGAGGFICGPDKTVNFLSAIENAVPGRPFDSPLLRAVVPKSMGGFGDISYTAEFHPGNVLFEEGDPALQEIVDWIRSASTGPGINVGNEMSHPKDLALSRDGRYLFVGNTGTMDVSIIDTRKNKEVSGIYIQNVANFVSLYEDQETNSNLLITLSMGAGFGAANARDPFGGETWDKQNPAAQYTILRDPETTDPYPLDEQFVLGPYDAIDGTWNIKMKDIQNDIIVVDLNKVTIPEYNADEPLDYLIRANKYESHSDWVRYTSDTYEATTGDVKGDIPPELQRVPGAFFEWAEHLEDKLYTSMAGTFEIVEWQIDPKAKDPANKLTPLRTFKTGLRPVGLTIGSKGPATGKLLVANQIGESISIIDTESGYTEEFLISDLHTPLFTTSAEKGELIVHTSVFTSDGDASCLHCHYRDGGDGRGWGAAESIGQNSKGHITAGGTLGIPTMRNTFAIQPYYFEGTHDLTEGQGADINEPASSIDFDRPIWAGDFTHIHSNIPLKDRKEMHEELKERVETRKLGPEWYDLEERRNEFIKQQSSEYFGESYGLRELYGFVGSWLGDNNHLFPNPYDQKHPSVKRGRKLFNSAQVMCGVCHTAPEFTNKTAALANNDRRALPVLVTTTRRDASYTLASVNAVDHANGLNPPNKGRVEGKEGTFTTMQLRNLFDRPPVFLHHGRARSLREVILTPEHPAARRFRYPVLQGDEEVRENRVEMGFNELQERSRSGSLNTSSQIFDSHGGVSHLTPRQINDLVNFIISIE